MMHRILFSLLLFTVVGCSGTPTAPAPTATPTPAATPTPTPTVGIRLGGDLNFGSVAIGASRDGVLTVNNPGTENLDIVGMSLVVDAPTPIAVESCMTMLVPLSPTRSITVAPGETLTVGFRFSPTSSVNCSGRLVVNSNATFGGREFRATAIGV